MSKVGFFEFVFLWFRLQGMSVPKHQKKIAFWLNKIWDSPDNRQALLMAFRNSGKSTIVGLFCAWVLYQNTSIRILVIAADYSLAKKMVRNVKRIIEQHPLTTGFKPSKLDQWASDQFTINRELELRDPSMLAKGLGANVTGLRADLIICDDVEVPKNCDTSVKRQDMREKLSELDYILTPSGMQLYIGTPHTYCTIYQTKVDEAKPDIEPFLLGFKLLKLPIIDKLGKSAWEERFSLENIASIRARSGENKFLSQMMLEAVNFTQSVLDVSRLVPYEGEISLTYSNSNEVLKIGNKKMLSASCCWDPAFGVGDRGDNSVVACVFVDDCGYYWLHDLQYIKVNQENVKEENIASLQCDKVIEFLVKNNLPSINIEVNGIGKFLPSILKQKLAQKALRIGVVETYSKQNKEQKIISAFEVLLAERALNVNKKIWQTGFIEEMRDWSMSGNTHDDALDAVASCLVSQPIRLPIKHSTSSKSQNWQGGSKQFNGYQNFGL